METRHPYLQPRPLLVIAIVLIILVVAGVWAWRHYPSTPEQNVGQSMDTLSVGKH